MRFRHMLPLFLPGSSRVNSLNSHLPLRLPPPPPSSCILILGGTSLTGEVLSYSFLQSSLADPCRILRESQDSKGIPWVLQGLEVSLKKVVACFQELQKVTWEHPGNWKCLGSARNRLDGGLTFIYLWQLLGYEFHFHHLNPEQHGEKNM